MNSSPSRVRASLVVAGTMSALATSGLLSSTAHAESQASIPDRSVALNVQADNADSHDATATFVLPLGQRMWTQLTAGSTRASLDDGSTTTRVAGAKVGVQTGSFQSQLGFEYHDGNDSLRLRDFSGSVTYFASQGNAGIDVFHRTAEDETALSRTTRLRNPRTVMVTHSSDGWGMGLHGDIDLSDRWTLFASGMKYNYQQSSNHDLALRIEKLKLSGVTRDTALLENTASVGATVKFQPVQWTLSYTRDHALDTGELTQTAELSANVALGKQWTVVPRVGFSTSDVQEDIAYAGITVQFGW